jgi:hypothetical protein
MRRRARTLDTVKLLRDWEGWPAGTLGTVVSEHGDTALVEVSTEADVDEHGLPRRNLFDDLIAVPYDAVVVVNAAAAATR